MEKSVLQVVLWVLWAISMTILTGAWLLSPDPPWKSVCYDSLEGVVEDLNTASPREFHLLYQPDAYPDAYCVVWR